MALLVTTFSLKLVFLTVTFAESDQCPKPAHRPCCAPVRVVSQDSIETFGLRAGEAIPDLHDGLVDPSGFWLVLSFLCTPRIRVFARGAAALVVTVAVASVPSQCRWKVAVRLPDA